MTPENEDRVAVAQAMLDSQASKVVEPADAPEVLERIMNDAAVERVKRMGYRIVTLRDGYGTTYEDDLELYAVVDEL